VDLSLEVLRGDVFGFLGPNGAGKTTTTIRMLLGLIRPTQGSVSLFGQDISAHLREVLPRIGAILLWHRTSSISSLRCLP
jgi:ABC-2 type transport system ATP-binding protein